MRISTIKVVYLYLIIETLLLLFYFAKILSSKFNPKIITFVSAFFIVLWILLQLKFHQKALDYFAPSEAIGIMGLSIYYFYEQLENSTNNLFSQHRFWVVGSYLIYTAGTFFLFLLYNQFPQNELLKYYVFNSVFLILRSLLLSVAMLMKNQIPSHKKFEIS